MSLTDLVYNDADDEALMIEVLRRSKAEYEEEQAEEAKAVKTAVEQSQKDLDEKAENNKGGNPYSEQLKMTTEKDRKFMINIVKFEKN